MSEDFDEIIKLIYHDRPVLVWTSIELYNPYVFLVWKDINSNEKIIWKKVCNYSFSN